MVELGGAEPQSFWLFGYFLAMMFVVCKNHNVYLLLYFCYN